MRSIIADTICQAFKTISARTWSSMHKNYITPIQKREDAFTAENLQDLYLLNSKNFTIFDFTPHVESNLTGADWEMWFVDDNGSSFGFAVQAKKLSSSLTYDIGYIPPSNSYPQINRLFDYCNQNHDLTPLYCFYNYFQNIDSAEIWPCKSFPESQTLWGCSISHGLNIKKLNSLNRNSINDILPLSYPWHCIVCCPGIGRQNTGTLSDRAAGFADTLKGLTSGLENENLSNITFENPEIQKLPKRIAALRELKNQSLTKELIDIHWKEYKPKQVLIIEDIKASS